MTAYVELRDLSRRRRLVEHGDFPVNWNDEAACLGLLMRLAQQNKVRPGDCELMVKEGRRSQTYRL